MSKSTFYLSKLKGICPNNKTIIGGENFEYGTISELKKNIGQNYFFLFF
jgi:hypothetical protein